MQAPNGVEITLKGWKKEVTVKDVIVKPNTITTNSMRWKICVADIAYSCIQQKIGGRHGSKEIVIMT